MTEKERKIEEGLASKKLGPPGKPLPPKPETQDEELPKTGRFDDGHTQ